MEKYTVCACGKDSFIIYRTSIECCSCAKTYHFNNVRYFSDIIDIVNGNTLNIVNDKINMSDKVYGIGVRDDNNGFGMTHGMVWDIKDMLAVMGEENSYILEFCNGDQKVLYKWDEVILVWIPFKEKK